jgi:hypothetical protein
MATKALGGVLAEPEWGLPTSEQRPEVSSIRRKQPCVALRRRRAPEFCGHEPPVCIDPVSTHRSAEYLGYKTENGSGWNLGSRTSRTASTSSHQIATLISQIRAKTPDLSPDFACSPPGQMRGWMAGAHRNSTRNRKGPGWEGDLVRFRTFLPAVRVNLHTCFTKGL